MANPFVHVELNTTDGLAEHHHRSDWSVSRTLEAEEVSTGAGAPVSFGR